MDKVISIAVPVLLTALILAFNEAIKERIKKSVSNATPGKVNRIFILLFVAIVLLSLVPGIAVVANETDDGSEDWMEETSANENTKSDVEAIVEGSTYAYEEVKEGLENKRKKDSIFMANRTAYWVYQVGNTIEDESDAWERAYTLNTVNGICIFKESRKSYIVICDRGAGEITDEDLALFVTEIDSIFPDQRISRVNLMDKCGKKEYIKEIDNITKRKHTETYRCLTCDK